MEFKKIINEDFKKYMITCSKCNSEAVFKQGIKKETGKPWSGYFCTNQDCKNVDWTPKTSKSSPQTQEKAPTTNESIKDVLIIELLQEIDRKLNKLLNEAGIE